MFAVVWRHTAIFDVRRCKWTCRMIVTNVRSKNACSVCVSCTLYVPEPKLQEISDSDDSEKLSIRCQQLHEKEELHSICRAEVLEADRIGSNGQRASVRLSLPKLFACTLIYFLSGCALPLAPLPSTIFYFNKRNVHANNGTNMYYACLTAIASNVYEAYIIYTAYKKNYLSPRRRRRMFITRAWEKWRSINSRNSDKANAALYTSLLAS